MSKRQNKQPAAYEPVSITPPAIEIHACATCGALLPQPIGRLDDIAGQAHLRRAVAVALVGKHSITFIGVGASLPDALTVGRISRRYGLTAYATTACMCGNTGDPYRACECTPKP